jgi:hypothetical protein
MSVVKFVRLHADGAGRSHLDHREAAIKSTEFAPPAPPLGVSATEPAEGWRFLQLPAHWVGDWHPSPARMWIFCLSGEMEFEVSDGTTHRVEPGGAMLLEDTTGTGHRSRVLGDRDVLLVAVQLQAPRVRVAAPYRPSPQA